MAERSQRQRLRRTHPDLGFWVDVRLRQFDGKWLAVADLADEPDVGTSEDLRRALRKPLTALGPRLAISADVDAC